MDDLTATNEMRLRPMTRSEYRGFIYGLDMIITWANQLEQAAATMPVTGITIPLEKQQSNAARQARSLARALKQGVACAPAKATGTIRRNQPSRRFAGQNACRADGRR